MNPVVTGARTHAHTHARTRVGAREGLVPRRELHQADGAQDLDVGHVTHGVNRLERVGVANHVERLLRDKPHRRKHRYTTVLQLRRTGVVDVELLAEALRISGGE